MITISSSQQALLKRNYKIASKVSVKDASGTWRSLTSLLKQNWVKGIEINHDIDSPVATASIELEKGADRLCISPFNEISLLNRLSGSYSPILDIGREIKIDVQLVPDYNFTPSSWLTIFHGYIDTINISQDGSVSLECRDLGARVQDTFIEEERIYSDSDGEPVEQIMQQILNDNGLSSITLYVPTSPGWYIKKYKQERVGVLDALQSLADQIGWSVKYKFRSSDSTWRLTLWCPERSATTPLYTFERSSVLNVRNLSIDISGIRNVISVWYGPANNRQQVVASDSNSINAYGRRFMEIQESSTSEIDTYTEAYTLANNILDDLKSPKAEIEITTFLFPFVELGDLYRFQGGNDLFTSDLDLAVVSYTHSITSSEFTTTLRCRGKPAGAYLRWHQLDTRLHEARDTIPPSPPSNFTLTPISGGFNISLPTPTEADWDGYEIHVSETSGFTPSESTLKVKGRQTSFDITDLPTKTYYVKVISYDTSGNRSEASSEASILTSPFLNPYTNKVQYDTYFDSIDGFTKSTTGSASIILYGYNLLLATGETQNSTAKIYKEPLIRATKLTWDKIRRFKTAIATAYRTYFVADIGIGDPSDTYATAIIFRLVGGSSNVTLYGYVMYLGNSTSTLLASNLDTTTTVVLEAIFIPSTGVYFYVNGVQAGSITTGLPSGETICQRIFYASLTNTSASYRSLSISEWHFIQED